MVSALQLELGDQVLEIGTGLGYQAAVLSFLCHEVFSIERFADFAGQAKHNLERAGIHNVHILVGDGSLGLPQQAPFDAIILATAAPQIPPPWRSSLPKTEF
jgi:protein-L-isoaspartate(D-aspartate) O-methyltransferase